MIDHKSVYGRGYANGFRDGAGQARREGWCHVQDADEIQVGDIVRIMVPLILRGLDRVRRYRVEEIFGENIRLRDLSSHEWGCDRIFARPHELAVLRPSTTGSL